MSSAAAGVAPPRTRDASLRRELRRAERRRQVMAFLLVAPLLAFILIFFILPIGKMLLLSVQSGEMREVMPHAAEALRGWDGRGLPDESVMAAFATDLAAAQKERKVAIVAKRLNYEDPDFRPLLISTARAVPPAPPASWRDALTGIDPKWGEPSTWAALRRASGAYTDLYLLAALDLKRGPNGIERVQGDQAIYLNLLGRTFWISIMVTLICLALGYPLAYRLATLPPKQSNLLMILVLLPFWTSLLVRTAAWVVLLQKEGVVNGLLRYLGLVSEPLPLIYNRFGVYVAMVHVLLPFMVLPLYSVMRGIPPVYVRAATSLGATPAAAFRQVYVPQTLPGIGAGSLLVFILAIGYYITPALVGGAADQMLSYFVAFFTIQTVNWGMAAALGSVLVVTTLILYAVYARLVGIDRMKLG
jgi:putative spermidine/putrescine transport system permease protein